MLKFSKEEGTGPSSRHSRNKKRMKFCWVLLPVQAKKLLKRIFTSACCVLSHCGQKMVFFFFFFFFFFLSVFKDSYCCCVFCFISLTHKVSSFCFSFRFVLCLSIRCVHGPLPWRISTSARARAEPAATARPFLVTWRKPKHKSLHTEKKGHRFHERFVEISSALRFRQHIQGVYQNLQCLLLLQENAGKNVQSLLSWPRKLRETFVQRGSY